MHAKRSTIMKVAVIKHFSMQFARLARPLARSRAIPGVLVTCVDLNGFAIGRILSMRAVACLQN